MGGVNKVHYGLSENDELHKDLNTMFKVQMVTVSLACVQTITKL